MTDQAIAEAVRFLLEQQELVRAPKREGMATAIGGNGSGPTAIFSLPGQAFVEAGRLRFPFPFGGSLTWGVAACNVAPTGTAIIIDVNLNGISVFASPTFRITIPAGANISPLSQISTQIAPFQYVTVDVDQVGSTLPGGDVTVLLGGPVPGGWLAT